MSFDKHNFLKRHMTTHSGVKKHACKHCGQLFSQRTNMLTHERRHTEFKCKYKGCTVKKRSEEELFDHIRNEHPVKDFKCNQCPMSFAAVSILKIHKRSHSDSRPFHCDICEKTFKKQCHVKDHKDRVHLGIKPHVCQVCGKGFADKRDLTRHTLVHTGEKLNACEYCGKRFACTSSLNRHQRVCWKKPPDDV
eukprot:sb/3471029/